MHNYSLSISQIKREVSVKQTYCQAQILCPSNGHRRSVRSEPCFLFITMPRSKKKELGALLQMRCSVPTANLGLIHFPLNLEARSVAQ